MISPTLILDQAKYEKLPSREGYGRGVVSLGEKDRRIFVLSSDVAESTRSNLFMQRFPDRFIQVGIQEQNIIGIAAGLSFEGKIPFVAAYGVFNPGRNWDQIRVSVCYSEANVKIIGAHTGIATGPDGATHQALEDIALMRVLPGMTVVVPADACEAEKATIEAGKRRGPFYIRVGREKMPVITTRETPFEIGRAEVFREGGDIAIIACGASVYESMLAAERLAGDGISASVVNCHTLKPLDVETIVKFARKCGHVATVEDHQITGGLGSAVAEALAENCPVPMLRIGVMGTFGESGSAAELLAKYGLDSNAIYNKVKSFLRVNSF